MDKKAVLEALLDLLKSELKVTDTAARDAAAYATDEESRADSQWDTQGLEASYLAAGQAGHAKVIADEIQWLYGAQIELLKPKDSAVQGALVTCLVDGLEEHYFFAPAAGGETVEVEGIAVTIITPHSPFAHRVLGKREGDSFIMPGGEVATITGLE